METCLFRMSLGLPGKGRGGWNFGRDWEVRKVRGVVYPVRVCTEVSRNGSELGFGVPEILVGVAGKFLHRARQEGERKREQSAGEGVSGAWGVREPGVSGQVCPFSGRQARRRRA